MDDDRLFELIRQFYYNGSRRVAFQIIFKNQYVRRYKNSSGKTPALSRRRKGKKSI